MSAYNWDYKKSCIWSSNPKYVNLAILLPIISSTSLMCNIEIVASLFYLMILVSFLHIFQLSPFPLVIVVIYGVCWCLKSIMYNKIYVSLWPCFEAKNLIDICYDFIFAFHVLSCIIFFMCAYFFFGICLCDIFPLRDIYTYEKIILVDF